MNRWIKYIQNGLLPSKCVLCGAAGVFQRDICEDCYNSLPLNNIACSRCALPLSVNTAGAVCGQCLLKPPPYARCISLFHYEAPVDYIVRRLKFGKDLLCARLLGALFANHLGNIYENQHHKPDVIIPVPLHKTRLRERGFNQAVEISRIIASHMRIPIDLRACQRRKMTLPQAELPANQRKQNLKAAFSFDPKPDFHHIAIVDDVMTTGHTINEMVNTINKKGVYSIDVWVCARANHR